MGVLFYSHPQNPLHAVQPRHDPPTEKSIRHTDPDFVFSGFEVDLKGGVFEAESAVGLLYTLSARSVPQGLSTVAPTSVGA